MGKTTHQSSTVEETAATVEATEDDRSNTEPEATREEPEAIQELPLDLTFEILKNERRRLVLDYLRKGDGETTIGDLAEHIAAIENDCDIQALGAQQRKRVYIGLYQCHLPKMDDAGVISFNQSRGHVELEPEAEPLFEYLEVSDDAEEDDQAETVDAAPYAVATVGTGVLFGVTQFMGYHFLASAFVFAFLASVLYLVRRSDSNE